jgi:hypothetical protein
MSGDKRECDGIRRPPKSLHGVLPRTTCGSFHTHKRHTFEMNDDRAGPAEATPPERTNTTVAEAAKRIYEDLGVVRAAAVTVQSRAGVGVEADEALHRVVRAMLRGAMGGTHAGEAMRQALTMFEAHNYPHHEEDGK